MRAAAPFIEPLSYCDKETVRLALQNVDLKIYAVASVSLSFTSGSRRSSVLNLQGALAFSRTMSTRQCNLQLLDLQATPGRIIWQHGLSIGANMVEEQANTERTYVLTDDDVRVACLFADDVEASKFSAKLSRTVRRCGKTELVREYYGRDLAEELDQILLDDETVRRTNRTCKALQPRPWHSQRGSDNRCTNSTSKSAGSDDELRQEVSRELAQSSTTMMADSQRTLADNDLSTIANNCLDGTHDANGRHQIPDSEIPFINSSAWSFTINGMTYQTTDLTAEIADVNEVVQSEVKFKGGCGLIRRARLKDGTDIAIKTLFTCADAVRGSQLSRGMRERSRFRNEVAMHSRFSHPNVLPLLGIAEAEAHGLGASLVLPWLTNSDSRRYVESNPDVLRLPLILGSIRGIAFLHSIGVVHGDIKARNILISDDGGPLLSDFGLTTFIDPDDRDISKSMLSAGSWSWMAIELIKSETPGASVTKYSDMWAFSMTVIELLTGDYPFPRHEAIGRILSHNPDKYPKRPPTAECTNKLWELVQDCWAMKPESRPSAIKALETIEVIASLL